MYIPLENVINVLYFCIQVSWSHVVAVLAGVFEKGVVGGVMKCD